VRERIVDIRHRDDPARDLAQDIDAVETRHVQIDEQQVRREVAVECQNPLCRHVGLRE
jgi:porphobilinogen deaminase